MTAGPSKPSESEIVEIDGPGSSGNQSNHDSKFAKSESPAGVSDIFGD